jgi:hypothetical protein
MGVNGFDPETGKVVAQIDQTMTGPMGHDRCYRNRITTRYYINSVTGGSDFLDLQSPQEFPNPWIRSTCGIGPLPCNGLLLRRASLLRVLQQRHAERHERAGSRAGAGPIGSADFRQRSRYGREGPHL